MSFSCLFRLIAQNFSCKPGLASGGGMCCFHILHSHLGSRNLKILSHIYWPILLPLWIVISYPLSDFLLDSLSFLFISLWETMYIFYTYFLSIWLLLRFLSLFLLHAEWQILSNHIHWNYTLPASHVHSSSLAMDSPAIISYGEEEGQVMRVCIWWPINYKNWICCFI